MEEDTSKKRSVQKLYVGGRSKEMAEELARMFAGGRMTGALTPEELSWLGESAVGHGATVLNSVVELALAVLLARATGRPLIDDDGCPIDRALASATEAAR